LGFLVLVALLQGCSIHQLAVNKLADTLASGGATFATEDDPELVKAAVPFGLKLMESLLIENPRHSGLLLAACSGFTQYSYVFVQQEAEEKEDTDLESAEALRARARRLYLRAKGYGLRGLEVAHPNLEQTLLKSPKAAVQMAKAADVPLLFWTAAAWAGAISVSKDDPALVADRVIMEALMDRALELKEDYGRGAIHSFLISYEMSRVGVPGDPAARARKHFERAMELSQGQLASPLVTLAEAVSVDRQDKTEFVQLLNRALAIDPDAAPQSRLENLLAQRRARWLLSRVDELFLDGGRNSSK
jgi:predicted anti-sigma-YlaC factor YlaD